MMYESLIVLAGAATALAVTPKGFEPAAEATLLVSFGNVAAAGGNVLAKEATQTAPNIGTQSQLDGTSFAVLMIDLDIPTNSPPATNTLLHWMQTGLTQSTTATPVNTSTGSTNAFLFQNSAGQAAFAQYLGPSPPARIPLSHRYTQVIVDTSDATDENLSVLEDAAASRMGFDALAVLTKAGLEGKVLAGNFFNVTNPGPAASVNSSTSATGGSAGSTATGTVSQPTQTLLVPAAAATQRARASETLLAIVMVGVVFAAL
ncbi:PEBP-like protein [Hypoxylon sp. NC1633]|nr:PEBP-like protein [Hypoxylon sp. NC1633]